MDIAALCSRLDDALRQGDDAFVSEAVRLLPAALRKGVFDGVLFDQAQLGSYTRRLVMGSGEDALVIRAMAWNKIRTPIHRHHGRPCLDVVVDGFMVAEEWEMREVGDLYQGNNRGTQYLRPGEVAVLTAENNIHAVDVPGTARSIHAYPLDAGSTTIYVPEGELFRAERYDFPREDPVR